MRHGKSFVLVALSVLALVGLALAAASTPHFDDLTAEVDVRQMALPTSDLTKDQKKEGKALSAYDKALAKTHADLLKDVKTGAKVDKVLAKVYADVEMAGLLDALLADLGGEVDDRFNLLDARVDEFLFAKPGAAAAKARDKAEGFLASAAEAVDHKTAYKLYKKALAKVRAGEKQADKAENPPNKCNGRSATGGEFAELFAGTTPNGSPPHIKVTVTRADDVITEYKFTATGCDGKKGAGFSVTVFGEPLVGFYSFGSLGGTRGSVSRVTGGAFDLFLTQASIEVTSYDAQNGVVEGTVTMLDNELESSTSMNFRTESGF